jgi:DNA-directed RNA polymerase specialized sigma24 family protein
VEDWERDFAAYVEGRRIALRGTAYLLCGDWHSADDLTQTALTRLYLVWRRIDRIRSIDAYVGRCWCAPTWTNGAGRGAGSGRRRTHRRAGGRRPLGGVDDRLSLEAMLRRLPPRQRAVLVLRYWCDLDVRATAEVLGISEGTVKSASARGLAAVREALQAPQPQSNQIGGEQ